MKMKKVSAMMIGTLMFALLPACSLFLPVKPQLDVAQYKTPCDEAAKTLIVMLPGRFDSPEDFSHHGFIKAVQQRGINADIAAVDLHLGYYFARTAVQRLHEDIILPARRKGYEHIWFAGISLGGFGSLLYGQYHPDTISGMVLIAPYLGGSTTQDEIAAAGGLTKWRAGDPEPDDYERRLWAWLKAYGDTVKQQADAEPKIYLGYGVSDRFAGSNRLAGAVLQHENVATTHGGHEWKPWLRLWETFLDKNVLPHCRPRDSV